MAKCACGNLQFLSQLFFFLLLFSVCCFSFIYMSDVPTDCVSGKKHSSADWPGVYFFFFACLAPTTAKYKRRVFASCVCFRLGLPFVLLRQSPTAAIRYMCPAIGDAKAWAYQCYLIFFPSEETILISISSHVFLFFFFFDDVKARRCKYTNR